MVELNRESNRALKPKIDKGCACVSVHAYVRLCDNLCVRFCVRLCRFECADERVGRIEGVGRRGIDNVERREITSTV